MLLVVVCLTSRLFGIGLHYCGSVLDRYSYKYQRGEGTDSILAEDKTTISNEDDLSMLDYSINDRVSSVTPEREEEEMLSSQEEICFGAVS